MKISKLIIVLFFLLSASAIALTVPHFTAPVSGTTVVDLGFGDTLAAWPDPQAFQATDALSPLVWWTVLAVLLLDIGAVAAYLYYQRQLRWRRTYWRLVVVEHQRLLAMLAVLYTPEDLTLHRYEVREQPGTGGFYLALKPEKASAVYGLTLFSQAAMN